MSETTAAGSHRGFAAAEEDVASPTARGAAHPQGRPLRLGLIEPLCCGADRSAVNEGSILGLERFVRFSGCLMLLCAIVSHPGRS